MTTKQQLPNATAVLVLGICSIVFGCFFVGLVLGIVGLSLGGKAKKLYRSNPGQYEPSGALNAGWVMSLIGTILGGLYTVYWLVAVVILGNASLNVLKLMNM